MNTNDLIDHVYEAQGDLWIKKVGEACNTGRFCQWTSLFHPQKLECQIDNRLEGGTFYNGSYNLGVKVVFSDSTTWMVRFPRVGKIYDDYADEKVAMEVSALGLLRNKTTIPVPKVQAWGIAASNPLGLGPYIIMDFINGVSLSSLFKDPDPTTSIIREDIRDSDLEVVYRQFANILLQIFQLDFDRIGSLPPPPPSLPPSPKVAQSPVPTRPLTFKAHDILQTGGVDTFGDRGQGFTSTTDYFQYLVKQDWEQLLHQPNSICGPFNAEKRYLAFKTLQAFVPDFVNAKYDRGKFKLICDDLGLGNLLVRSKDDLTVVGVVDLEWSYIGPAQLFGSAPWWLLEDRPINPDWDYKTGEAPKVTTRYFKCLEIFIRILEEEEEACMLGHKERELSNLVRWSQASGAMWLHMLLSVGFNDTNSFPFTQLRQHVGDSEWVKREKQFDNIEEVEAFAALKVQELKGYKEALGKIEEEKALVDVGKMTKEEFIANNLVEDKRRNDEGIFEKVTAWLYLRAAELRTRVAIARDNWNWK